MKTAFMVLLLSAVSMALPYPPDAQPPKPKPCHRVPEPTVGLTALALGSLAVAMRKRYVKA